MALEWYEWECPYCRRIGQVNPNREYKNGEEMRMTCPTCDREVVVLCAYEPMFYAYRRMWTCRSANPNKCRHVGPRTLEDVLQDRIDDVLAVMTSGIPLSLETALNDSFGEECADEIRAMFGEVDHD